MLRKVLDVFYVLVLLLNLTQSSVVQEPKTLVKGVLT